MKILVLGDVVGRSGRDAVVNNAYRLKKELNLTALIVNGENAAQGRGITPKICEEFFKAGVDCITTGDHIWDQKEIIPFIEEEKKLIRPANYPPMAPGRGVSLLDVNGKKVLVINLMGRVFMGDALDCPFRTVDNLLEGYLLGRNVDAIVVDLHAEATSEKMAMGHYLNGRVSLVVGTHTHVPTADVKILSQGTGYQTDMGMTGDYNSIIGVKKEEPLNRFLTRVPRDHYTSADGKATLSGVIVDLNTDGTCKSIERFALLDQ